MTLLLSTLTPVSAAAAEAPQAHVRREPRKRDSRNRLHRGVQALQHTGKHVGEAVTAARADDARDDDGADVLRHVPGRRVVLL